MSIRLKDYTVDSDIYLNVNEKFVSLNNETRKDARDAFLQKVASGNYRLEKFPCLCGNDNDLALAEVDRYGIPTRTVLCRSCGLLRTDPYYTDETLGEFYASEYRAIYTGRIDVNERFFENQINAGKEILAFVESHVAENGVVYEVGAGAGGILKSFINAGWSVKGCDLGKEYLAYGVAQGIDLVQGNIERLAQYDRADLIILNHFLEHEKDPVALLKKAVQLLKPNGKIFIGLPGLIFFPVQYRGNFLYYLQNAHCYHYTLKTLEFVASKAGLRKIKGDEQIMSLFESDPSATEMALPDVSDFILKFIDKSEVLRKEKYSNNEKIKTLNGQIKKSELNIAKLKETAVKNQKTISDKNNIIAGDREKLRENATAIKSLEKDIAKQNLQLDALKAELEEERRQKSVALRKLRGKEGELKQIKASPAWRYISFQRKILKKIYILQLITAIRKWHAKNKKNFKRSFYNLFKLLPLKENVVLFESHRGLSYSDNPKYICEELLRQKLPLTCVWSLQQPELKVPEGIKTVERFSLRYFYFYATSKFLIHNGEFGQALPIRKKQIYINTQHGTPLKKMGTDILHKKPEIHADNYTKNGRWSYMVSPNAYTTDIFKRVYVYDGPVLEVGYPRNDLFYTKNNPTNIDEIKHKYNFPTDKKVVIYAPTWRDKKNSRTDKNFQLELDLKAFYNEFKDTHILILRLHHLISTSLKLEDSLKDVIFECSTANFDIQELLLVSDILITDYSSVMFDYANLLRPTIFFTYDLDEYVNDTRGTYFDLQEKSPGPLVKTSEELMNTIANIDTVMKPFAQRQKAFNEKFCSIENGSATKQVIDAAIKPVLKK